MISGEGIARVVQLVLIEEHERVPLFCSNPPQGRLKEFISRATPLVGNDLQTRRGSEDREIYCRK
jgi:hypothetical protein